jgi:uncharacterized membrane protein
VITLANPAWLLVALPLAAALAVWQPPSRLMSALRIVAYALLVLALAGLAIRLESRAGTVVIVADRSLSMPDNVEARAREIIDLVSSARPDENSLAVVSFARAAAIEQASSKASFGGFTGEVGDDASALAGAIDTALALVPAGTTGRVLLLTDGRATGADPLLSAAVAADRGVAIDFREISRSAASDVAIVRLDAPSSVETREALFVGATVHSPVAQEISVALERDGRVIASGRRRVESGESQLLFRDRAEDPGTLSYTLRVRGEGDDPMPENNTARLLVGVRGSRPVLLVSGTGSRGLPTLLRRGGLDLDVRTRQDADWSLDRLSGYSAVVLENLPADAIGRSGMQNLAAWVQESGGGLMMTGGQKSFGAGGYFQSPIDPVLPVSLELRREHRKFSVAIVVALDRSGSMSMSAGGGRTKMDLANISAVQVLDLLSPFDEFGVIAVDSLPHHIADLTPVENAAGLREKILAIESQGGGIYVYEALAYASRMLVTARAQTRHIILFADAADAEEPGEYRQLLTKAREANISVSVIGLGTPTDSDAELLRDVARVGGGNAYFTNDPMELPRIFAQDTMIVARSTFVDEPSAIDMTGGLVSITGQPLGGSPVIGGYNLTYLKDTAILGSVTLDDQAAPVIAAWQAGLGRALALTAEADGEFTGELASWPATGELVTGLVRWTAGTDNPLPIGMMLSQAVRGGATRIELEIDPNVAATLTTTPVVTLLRGRPGEAPKSESLRMDWVTPELLAADVPFEGRETILPTVRMPGGESVTLAPSVLPYSPEFAPGLAIDGGETLRRLARITGGREQHSPASIWSDLPSAPRRVDLTPWLLIAAMMLLLLEVLERRTGALSLAPALWAERRAERAKAVRQEKPATMIAPVAPGAAATPPPDDSRPSSEDRPAEPSEKSERPAATGETLQSALKRARQRAKDRTGE